MSYDIKQVIVVRKDLNMRKGKIAAQVAHASMKVLLDSMKTETVFKTKETFGFSIPGDKCITRVLSCLDKSYINQWLTGSFAKVVVSCTSEEELLELQDKAEGYAIPTALITDSGATEFKGVPTLTCLAIGPHDSEEINKITGHLKLL
jgi:PTH2 family peptidyl-tRNA hydrolase